MSIYRPFFVCGTVTVLSAGCLLGALALFGLAMKGSYLASAWTPYVLAHANSQLYGWVGFFIIGFSLQHHAPTVARERLFHRLAWTSLGLMGTGIVLRFVAEPLAQSGEPFWVATGVASAWCQAAAVLAFVVNTTVTRYRPTIADGTGLLTADPVGAQRQRPPWQTAFVFLSLGFLVVVSLVEPVVFAQSHQPDRLASIQFVAEWFAPLREAQFLGFVASMIFGVALVKVSECLGAKEPSKELGLAGLGFWTLGLLARIGGWVAYYRAGMIPGSGALYYAGGALLCIGAVFVVAAARPWSWRLRPGTPKLRSHKFVLASFTWLLVAGLMMVVEPLVLQRLGLPFSHAYTGAVRHAVTVGFISQMIIGFSLRIVPSTLGLDDAALPRLWPTFWLLNVGNTLRVALEVATDFTPLAFKPMGLTGFVELVGLALWGAHLLKLLARHRAEKGAVHAA